MALNFADVASKKLEEIERPPLPPVGTYRFSITKLPIQTTTNDDKWDILTIPCRALEAQDDVDMSDYNGEVSGIMNAVKFMFDKEDEVAFERSLYQARTFFEKHVKCAQEGDSLAQAMNNCVNQQFLGSMAWKPDKIDPEVFHANIVRTAPLD